MKYDYDPAVAQWAWPHLQNDIPADRLVNVLTDECGYSGPIARRVISAIGAPMHNDHNLVFAGEPAQPSWAMGDVNRGVIADTSAALVFASLDPHLELVAGVLTASECQMLQRFAALGHLPYSGTLAQSVPRPPCVTTDPGFALLAGQVRLRLSQLFNWPLTAIGPLLLWPKPEAPEPAPPVEYDTSPTGAAPRAVIWLCLDVADASSTLDVFNFGMLVRPKPGYGFLVSAALANFVVPSNMPIMASVSFDTPT